MKIVNLTPHPLVIQRQRPVHNGAPADLEIYAETIPSSGLARCATVETVVGSVDGIPIVITTFGAVEGLPPFRAVCTACLNCEDAGEQEWGYCRVCGGNIEPNEASCDSGSDFLGFCDFARAVEGVPQERDDAPRPVRVETIYVVSSITAQAVRNRPDVFVPARPVRDEQGRIVACTALGRIHAMELDRAAGLWPLRPSPTGWL